MKQSSPAVNLQLFFVAILLFVWSWGSLALAQDNSSSVPEPPLNEQSLVYDLTMNGQIVGQRRVRIQYLPASSKLPYGSRIVESWTSLDYDVPLTGKNISYTKRATGHFSARGSKFVSVVDVAGDGFEFQGNQRQGGMWNIYEQQGKDLSQRKLSSSEMQSFSLALFDPGQLEQWISGANRNIYHVEMGELWTGSWTQLPSKSISVGDVTLEGIAMHYQSTHGELDVLWSDSGLVLDFTLRVNGLVLDANLRSLPAPPQFGNIAPILQFDGVEEESL